MDKKFAITTVIVLGVIVLGAFWLTRPAPVNVNTPPAIVNNVGSASSPSVINGCEDINGFTTCYYSTSFSNSTSTVCSFKSPTSTSTIVYASAKVTTGSTTATEFEWGKSANWDATTTSLGRWFAAATAPAGVFQASTTADALISTTLTGGNVDDVPVIAPNNYLNLKFGNTNCGTTGAICSSLVGTCKAIFRVN